MLNSVTKYLIISDVLCVGQSNRSLSPRTVIITIIKYNHQLKPAATRLDDWFNSVRFSLNELILFDQSQTGSTGLLLG